MSAKKMRNFSRHKNTGDLHRWYVFVCGVFIPADMYWKYLILNAAASSLDVMHDGLVLYIRCSCRDFFESFASLGFFAFLWFVFGDTRNRSSACLHFFQLADANSLTRWLWISKFSISEAFLKFFTFVRQTKKRFCLPQLMWTWPTIQLCSGQM